MKDLSFGASADAVSDRIGYVKDTDKNGKTPVTENKNENDLRQSGDDTVKSENDSGIGADKIQKTENNDVNTEANAGAYELKAAGDAAADRSENTNEVHNSEQYKVFDGALFIGDSRTEGLSLYSGIKNADFFCAKSLSIDKVTDGNKVTVGGSKMSVYELLDSKQYSKVYISLGLNELGWTHIEKYIDEYKTLIEAVHGSQPDAVIVVQALLPVTKEKSDKGGTVNNAQIYWYNTNLAQMASDMGVTYINADEPLIDAEGALLSDSTTDGVHLKSEYCKIWAAELAELSADL
ncbi:MAG: hypothetical protein HFG67_05935 [Firmicutes bacterium]|nr:hypothetical protein [Bacillota bacterium]